MQNTCTVNEMLRPDILQIVGTVEKSTSKTVITYNMTSMRYGNLHRTWRSPTFDVLEEAPDCLLQFVNNINYPQHSFGLWYFTVKRKTTQSFIDIGRAGYVTAPSIVRLYQPFFDISWYSGPW